MSNALVPDARIVEEVQNALAKSLRKPDPRAIPMDASIIEDLNGTSLDFLDMTFRLEQTFGLRLAHTTVLDHIEETFGEGKAIDKSGCLTKDAVTVLKMRMGDLPGLVPGMYADEIPKLVTPDTLANGVREITKRLPEKCTHCSAASWTSPDGAKVKCGACGKDAAYPEGDALTKGWLQQVSKEQGLFA